MASFLLTLLWSGSSVLFTETSLASATSESFLPLSRGGLLEAAAASSPAYISKVHINIP
jgi:hypothetical protein